MSSQSLIRIKNKDGNEVIDGQLLVENWITEGTLPTLSFVSGGGGVQQISALRDSQLCALFHRVAALWKP